tara:strand:- start:2716 stop:3135 length:420 start_codon:yes stop_codon:yes gene_type:complete
MPGENPLPIGVAVDHQQDLSFALPITSGLGTDNLLHFCERETVVDAASIGCITGDDDCAMTLKYCPVNTSTGAITAVGSGTAFTDALTITTSEDPKREEFTLITTENVIPANSYIALDGSATSTAVSGNIHLRIRTKRR